MKRVIRALQQSALVTFFGNIAFDKNGMNYNAIAAVVQVGNLGGCHLNSKWRPPSLTAVKLKMSHLIYNQVFTVTQDLKVVNAPSVVLPAVEATQALVIPRPNIYAPVCPPGSYQNPNDYLPCIPCPAGERMLSSL